MDEVEEDALWEAGSENRDTRPHTFLSDHPTTQEGCISMRGSSRKIRTVAAALLAAAMTMGMLTTVVPDAAAIQPPQTPDDPLFAQQWGPQQVRAPQAWETSHGEGAVIAVVDSGIELAHEDLASRVIPGQTFVGCGDEGCGNGDWRSGSDEPSSHGTHVSGIAAAATHNGTGIAGVAPGADLLAVKVATSGFLPCLEGAFRDVARGIRWAADNGADVINLSLGHPVPVVSQGCQELFTEVHQAVEYANTKDVVTVAAAGNEGFIICSGPPGTAPGAICVTSTDRREARAAYSNEPVREDLVAVSAPGGSLLPICGEDILSTVPMGTANATNAQTCGWGSNNSYEELAGTSMASPHVAGVAALAKSQGCTREETIDIITSTSRQPLTDVRGVFTPLYGYGIVDAEAVVGLAAQVCEAPRPNLPPIPGADGATTDEDTPVTIDVLSNDTDPDGDPLTVAAVIGGDKGAVVSNGDGTVTYTPEPHLNGSDTFTYRVSDGIDQAVGTVSVEIVPVPDPPEAADDNAFFKANTPKTIDVLANDSDPDGDNLTVISVTRAAHGTASNGLSGVTYTPNLGYRGFDAFTYRVGDGTGRSSTAQVSMFGPDCQTAVFFDDIEGDPLTTTDSPLDRGWTTELAANNNPTTARWFPHDDPQAHSPTQSWTNDAASPDVKDDRLIAPAQAVTPSTKLTFWHRYLFEDSFDGGVLEVSTDGGQSWQDVTAAGGTFVEGGYDGLIDTRFSSPVAGRQAWTGSSGIGYPAPPEAMSRVVVDLSALAGETVFVRWRLALDSLGGIPGAAWWVDDVEFSGLVSEACTQAAQNLLPTAVDDDAFTNQETGVTVDVLANDSDPDGDELALLGVGDPANGSTATNPDDTVTYTPDVGFHGADTFTYVVSDARGGTSSATVTVTVNGQPLAASDSAETHEGVPVTVSVLANDADPEDDAMVVASFTQGADGAVSCEADACTYSPDTWFLGTDTFTYEVCDAFAACATAEVTIDVVPGPDAISCSPAGRGFWRKQFDPVSQRKFTQAEIDAITERAADLSSYFPHRFAVSQAVDNDYGTDLEKAEHQYALLLVNMAAGDLSASMSYQAGLSGAEQLSSGTYDTATVGGDVDAATAWIRAQLPDGELSDASRTADRINNGNGLIC